MAFFDRNRSSHGGDTVVKGEDDDSRHPDGKFKMGPANTQRKMGDSAFQSAKDHIDHAATAARGGDEQAADFHVGMAQQYAALGSKNHLMGKYVDDTKGKTPMPVMQQAQTAARKAEGEITRLQKSWDDWNASHAHAGTSNPANAGKTYQGSENGWETEGETANRMNPHPGKKATAATPEEWKKGNDTGGANFAQANRMNSDHYAMGNMHNDKSQEGSNQDVQSAHFEANGAHGVAQHHAYLAGQSYMAGQKQIGDEHLSRAIGASREAHEASGRAMMAEMKQGKK